MVHSEQPEDNGFKMMTEDFFQAAGITINHRHIKETSTQTRENNIGNQCS